MRPRSASLASPSRSPSARTTSTPALVSARARAGSIDEVSRIVGVSPAEVASQRRDGQVARATHDDADRVGALGVAHGEQRIVAPRRGGADHHGVGGGAHAVDLATALRRGNPAGLTAGRRDLAVERHGRLEGDERQAAADVARERLVQLLAERMQGAGVDGDLDAGGAQGGDAAAVDRRVGVDRPDHHPRHAGGQYLLGAGARVTLATARLEGRVELGALGAPSRLFKGHGLGVSRPRPAVIALAHHLATGHHDGPDARIGVSQTPAQASQLQSAVQIPVFDHKKPRRTRGSRAIVSYRVGLLSSGL